MTLVELCLRIVRRSSQCCGRLSTGFGSSITRPSTHFIQSASSATLLKNPFLPLPSYLPVYGSCQVAANRRKFSSHAVEDSENRLEGSSHAVTQSEVPTPSTSEAHASTVAMPDAGNEETSLQDAASSDSDVDSVASAELREDDDSQRIALAEKDFYDVIEVEESVDELLSMLLRMEKILPRKDPRVCRTCLRLAILCNDTNQQTEKIVDYARQAFHNFDSSKFPLESATALFMVGVGYYKIGESKEAVTSLEKCAFLIERLELPCTQKEELTLLQSNCQLTLGQAKISLGWNVEGLCDLRKGLAALEKALSPENIRLASCYHDAALSFLQAKEPKEALDVCRKAILAFSRSFGPCCLHIANIRSLMSQIHYELGECESVLSECQQAVQILNLLGETNKATRIDLDSIEAYFLLGKLDEAVSKLNEIVKKTKQSDPLHVEALILLVKGFIHLEDETSAAQHSQRALNALEKTELNFDSAKTMIRLATCFQQLQDFDHALAISQRAITVFEECTGAEVVDYAADARGYRGSLSLAIGKHGEALLDLEKALALKKSIYGSESVELLDIYNYLGVAHAHAGNVDEALAVFQDAKRILNVADNGVNLTSLYIYNNLSITFILSGRTGEARETKRHAVCMIRKAGKDVLLSADEVERQIENLIRAKESGTAATISDKQILKQMLPACVTS